MFGSRVCLVFGGSEMTPEQRKRADEARDSLKRHIQQMISSGQYDLAAVKVAMQDILGEWI